MPEHILICFLYPLSVNHTEKDLKPTENVIPIACFNGISSNVTLMIDFSSVSDCPLNSVCVKYYTGDTYSIGKIQPAESNVPIDEHCNGGGNH
jgi:hypothetical protein